MGRQLETTPAPPPQHIEESIRHSITEVQLMRDELARRAERITELEREVMMLRSEKSVLELMHTTEATERAYYHRFAVEVSAGLGLVAQIVDDVIQKANQSAMHDDGRRGESLPVVEIPGFLKNGPREGETNGNASHQ